MSPRIGYRGAKQSKLVDEPECVPLERVSWEFANDCANMIRTSVDAHCDVIEVVGSIRRHKATVNDVDFVVIADDRSWSSLQGVLSTMYAAKFEARGNQIIRSKVVLNGHWIKVDFYRANEQNYAVTKLVRTGSAEHNIWLATHAIKNNMRLNYSSGVSKMGKEIHTKTEEEIFEALGLGYIKPEEREIGLNGEGVYGE